MWLAPLLTVALAILVSLVCAEGARFFAALRLDDLRSAHWTEQAHVFTQTNNSVRMFRLYMVTVTTVLVLFGVADLTPQQALRFGAWALLLITLTGDPLGGRWVQRATAGTLRASPWLEAHAFGLVMFPARWVLIVFGALTPARYDAVGWIWLGALLVTLVFVQAGGAALLCRSVGIVRPASPVLEQIVLSVAQAAGSARPQVYELKLARTNALAMPMLGWVVFTSAAVEQLEPRALAVIAAHELGHLRESRLTKVVRVASGTALIFPLAFVLGFPDEPLIGLGYGCGLFVVIAFGMRLLSVRLERRADALAHHQEHDHGEYAAALERVYQLNWMAAGVINRTHPSLYDRMEKAGVKPSYPRPKRPARGPTLLALAFGLLGALALAFIVNPMLAEALAGR
jgi:Zn-dependent protease with chaperone function